jgi:catechol 2,3-dioxygenase-like lactoylglutathione lyase family enzyme
MRPLAHACKDTDAARSDRGLGMDVNGISHINIGVTDLERSVPFYTDILGLEISVDREEIYEGINLHQHAVYLRWSDEPGSSFVVLDQQLNIEPFGTAPVFHQTGPNHFGFWVRDVEAIVERARAAGMDVRLGEHLHEGGAYGDPTGKGRVRSTVLHDPDGTIIQLDQWVELPPAGPSEPDRRPFRSNR